MEPSEFPNVDDMDLQELKDLRAAVNHVEIFLIQTIRARESRLEGYVNAALGYERQADVYRGSLPTWARQD